MKRILSLVRWPFENVVRRLKKSAQDKDLSPPWFEHYDAGVPKEISIPNITMHDILQRSAEAYQGRTAFSFYGKKYSFTDLWRITSHVAAALQELGILKGDRIALILPNTPQFLFAYWATLRLGAIVAPINPLLSGREARNLLDLVEPKLVIVLDRLYDRMQKNLADVPAAFMSITSVSEFMPPLLQAALRVKAGRRAKPISPAAQSISFQKLVRHASFNDSAKVRPEDTAALLFTGGVTGTPKAVQLTHYNLVANVLQTRAWLGALQDGRDVVMGMLPFFHSYGMTVCHHLAIQVGATLILEPRFNVKRAIQLSNKYKVTIFPGVPTMYRAIVDDILHSKKKLESVRICVSGGAPLNLSLKREFEAVTHSKLVEGYGLSEASPLTHCNPLYGTEKSGSIGLPCPNTTARIVQIDSDKIVPTGAVGELQVKGPQVMQGYWQNPHETANVLSEDGWLATGDMAQMDKDGFFYIVDRKKDLILSGGFNIYPSEVEDVLVEHSAVKECAVVGARDDYYGEHVKAYVVLHRNTVCRHDELQQFCRDHLAHFKVPKHITFVDELPKNFLGKVLRRSLLE